MVPDQTRRLITVLLCLLLSATAWAGNPRIESWQTGKGSKVMFVAAPTLPMVDIRVVFDAGSARDEELPGLAKLTNAVLDQGAGGWSADQIAVRLEDHGVEIGNGSLRDMAWYSIRSLTEPDALEVALDTLAAVIAEPRFAKADVERTRQQMQIGLRQSLQSPGTVARRAFFRSLYGDHPYGHDPSGEPESLAQIALEDLKAFHQRFYVARNAVIAIVGAVDRGEAARLAERLSEALDPGEPAPRVPAPSDLQRGHDQRSFPSSQSHLYLGQIGMARHDPDYFPLYVGNHVLGGSGLVSILGEEVRNKRGLSYSVYSYFSPMRVPGPFVMVAQTKNEQVEQADRVMRETLQRFIEQGPKAEELQAAIKNITGGFPLRIASNKKILEYIAMMGFYDYPLDWLETLIPKVEAVTVEAVQDAFRRRVDPQGLVSVTVGGSAETAGGG